MISARFRLRKSFAETGRSPTNYNFVNKLGTHSEYNEAQRNPSLRLGKKH
jgi:hypothetical protein